METPAIYNSTFYDSVREIVSTARQHAYRAVNAAMVEAYWNIGKLIVEEEQNGAERAKYGKELIKMLSTRLTEEFGKGFSRQSLWNMRRFYLTFPKLSTLWRELSWSHYKALMRVEKTEAREYYLKEAVAQNWSVRALQRQINSLYYERLLSSQNKQAVQAEAETNTQKLAMKPEDVIKDPYILEFLNLHPDVSYLEKDLEQALIDKLQHFLLELGKGFAFVARQQRISTETKEFYLDLVFYNYLLKCFVLIDLKTGELTHQDIGQMDMYVRIYEDRYKAPDDNPTIGIILCTEKDETVVKYSVLNGNDQLFASKYRLYLPTEQELAEAINREKYFLLREKQEEYSDGKENAVDNFVENWKGFLKGVDSDEEIDYSDIPPLGEEFFQRAKLYVPGTHTVILDDDVFAWLQHQNKDYHSLVNTILRQHIERQHTSSPQQKKNIA